MIHAAESCKFLESFGNDLTIPVRTRSRLKHILLENTYGENFMEHKPFLIEDVEFHHQGTYAENDSSKYNSVKPSASVIWLSQADENRLKSWGELLITRNLRGPRPRPSERLPCHASLSVDVPVVN